MSRINVSASPVAAAPAGRPGPQKTGFGRRGLRLRILSLAACLGCAVLAPDAQATVGSPPTISTQPTAQTVAEGATLTLTVAASNATSYQWYYAGGAISSGSNASAATATLSVAAVTASNVGQYSVVVSNASGSVTSAPLYQSITPATGHPTLPTIASADFLVTNFGAVADNGITDNTGAIQAALNAASAAGGGTVEFPGGTSTSAAIYMTGPGITVPSNINFQVDQYAIVCAFPCKSTTSPGTFANGATEANIMTVPSSANVEFSGAGIIDGNGGSDDIPTAGSNTSAVTGGWWTNSSLSRPRILNFTGGVSNVLVTGLTFENAPEYHVYFSPSSGVGASNVTVSGMTVNTTFSSPNTDGVDPSGAHVLIENDFIQDGDDNIAVKAQNVLCTDITITDCTFGTGHGLSVGGQTNDGLNGMKVTNCTFNSTQYGFRLKADPTQGGPLQNVTYSNCVMNSVEYPIIFYSYYSAVGTPGQTTLATAAKDNTTPTSAASGYTIPTGLMPTWSNITISNLTINDTTTTNFSLIWGLPDTPSASINGMFQNVTLNNVNFSGGASTGRLSIYDAQNVQVTGTSVLPVASNSSNPAVGYDALAILTQPSASSVSSGGTATFTVGVLPTTSGTAGTTVVTPTYQWLFNGSALANGTQTDGSVVAGATSATLSISNAQVAEMGAYAATVTESLDSYSGTALVPGGNVASATSASANLSILPSITTQPVAQSVVAGGTTSFSVVAVGNPAPTYQWSFGGTSLSNGTQADGSVVAGATSATLTLSNAQLADSTGSVVVLVSNSAGSASSTPVALSVLSNNQPPSITAQPISQTANAGAQVTFSVAAVGNPTPAYQWSFNGSAISAASSSSLVLTNVQTSNAGSYTATASNSNGSVVSSPAVLTVDFAPIVTTPPAPQTVNAGSTVSFSVVANGNPSSISYQWLLGGSAIGGATSASYSIATAVPASAGTYAVTVSNSVGSVTTTGATLIVDFAPIIVSQPSPASAGVVVGSSVTFSATISGVPAPTYQWSFGGTVLANGTQHDGSIVSGATTAVLGLSNLQTSDSGSYSLTAQNGISPSAITNAAVLSVVPTGAAPTIQTQPASVTVTAGATANFSVVAQGSPAPTFQWSYNGTPISGATSSTLSIGSATVANDGTYSVVASNTIGTAVNTVTSTGASLTVDTVPVITTQPASKNVLAGGSVTLTVVASGIPAPSYQWSFGGTSITGATSASYTLVNASTATVGSYAVMASNSAGSVQSNPAVIAIGTAPSITTQPASLTVGYASSATFSVVAAGSATLSYQWSFGSTVLAGATSSSYTVASALPSTSGNYSVVVSNSLGSVASSPATLTLSLPTGTYSGVFGVPPSPTGNFAILFYGNGTGTFLAYDPISKVVVAQYTFSVSNDTFSFTVPISGSSAAGTSQTPALTSATLSVAGTVTNTGVSGSVTGGSSAVSFSGAPYASTGSQLASAGFYQTGVVGSSGSLSMIIAPDGSVYALAQTSSGAVSGLGTLTGGVINIPSTTSSGTSITGTLTAGGLATADLVVTGVGAGTTAFSGGNQAALSTESTLETKSLVSVGTGESRAIEGFVVAGTARPILLLGLGPELNGLGVTGALPKAELDLYSNGVLQQTNTGWSSNASILTLAATGPGFALQGGQADAGILTTTGTTGLVLAPGAYTALLSGGTSGATGVGMVSLYDTGTASAGQTLLNTSIRGLVPANGSLVHGFTVEGTVPTRFLIRAVGPTLVGMNGFGGTPLGAPILTVHNASNDVVVAANTNWSNSADGTGGSLSNLAAAATTAGAFQLGAATAQSTTYDSAVLVTLNPGTYDATATGPTGASGVVLIEVYQLP